MGSINFCVRQVILTPVPSPYDKLKQRELFTTRSGGAYNLRFCPFGLSCCLLTAQVVVGAGPGGMGLHV
jgi:hypothetical protein